MKNSNEEYKLMLSDGNIWGFKATPSIKPWLDEFARILKLEKSEIKATQRIFFLARDTENLPDYVQRDWNTYKQGKVYRIWSKDGIPEIFVELNTDFINHSEIRIINMWSTLKSIYRFYVDNNAGPIHTALAEYNGKGILIAAAGGTGKSTCMSRLPDYWNPLSDDNALIVIDKIGNYRVHPMPTWSDHLWQIKQSTFLSSYSVPVNAIFFLEQSENDEVKRINKIIATQKIHKSFIQIWQTYLTRLAEDSKLELTKKLFDNAYNLANLIPCYKLKATLTGKFWENIEEVL